MTTGDFFRQVVRTDAFCTPDFEVHRPIHPAGSRDVTFHYVRATEMAPAISVLVLPSGYGFAALPRVSGGIQ